MEFETKRLLKEKLKKIIVTLWPSINKVDFLLFKTIHSENCNVCMYVYICLRKKTLQACAFIGSFRRDIFLFLPFWFHFPSKTTELVWNIDIFYKSFWYYSDPLYVFTISPHPSNFKKSDLQYHSMSLRIYIPFLYMFYFVFL